MSDLEKYILENRDELDRMEAVPEAAMWQKICANSTRQKPPARTGFHWKWLALAALALSAAGWGLLFLGKKAAPTVPPSVAPTKMETPIAEQKQMPDGKPDQPVAEQKETPQVAQLPIAQAKKKKWAAPQTRPANRLAPAPETSAEERELQRLVAQKQREIGLDTLNRAAYADLLSELDELEISVEEARRDLGGMPQRERLMETLLRYYELKIRILEQINYEINKQKYHAELEKRI